MVINDNQLPDDNEKPLNCSTIYYEVIKEKAGKTEIFFSKLSNDDGTVS